MSQGSTFPQFYFISWLLLLVWAPLPFGSYQLWPLTLLILSTGVLAIFITMQALYSALPVHRLLKPYRWPILLLLPIPLWVSVQTLPLSMETLAALSPRMAEIYRDVGMAHGYLSVDRAQTQVLAAWSWCLWLFFIMAFLLLDTRERLRSACIVIVYCGVFQALYGSFMTLSGLEYDFFAKKIQYIGVATGTFRSRNLLAGYLVLCLAIGIGLLVANLRRERSANMRDRMRGILDTLLGSKLRLRVFLALMVIALVLTRSRMGNAAFFGSLFATAVVLMLLQRKLHKGALVLFASLLLVDFIIVGQWFGFDELAQRLESTTAENESRVEVVDDSLAMIRDFPLTGTGLGTYVMIYPQYQQLAVSGYYDYAHNDYLQFASELGLPAMLPLAALVLASLARALYCMARRRDQLARGMAFASAMGIVGILVHSSVDFNLYMPSTMLVFMVVLALGWKAGTVARQTESTGSGSYDPKWTREGDQDD